MKTSKAEQSLVLLCTLGCAVLLLFPVISATDDLHAMRPEMEESERAFRHAGPGPCALHALAHCAQPALPEFAFLTPAFQRFGTVSQLTLQTKTTLPAPAPAGRAPPADYPTWL